MRALMCFLAITAAFGPAAAKDAAELISEAKQCGKGAIESNYPHQVACQRSFNAASIMAAIALSGLDRPQHRECWLQVAAHDRMIAEMARKGPMNALPADPSCASEADIGDYDRTAILRICPGVIWSIANRGETVCNPAAKPSTTQTATELKCGPNVEMPPQQIVEFHKGGGVTEQVLSQGLPCQQVIEYLPDGTVKQTTHR